MLVRFHLDATYELAFEVFDQSSSIPDSVSIIFTPSKPALKLQMKMQSLRIIYNTICENVELTNRSMGATISTLIAVLITVTTSSLYRILLTIIGKAQVEKASGRYFK